MNRTDRKRQRSSARISRAAIVPGSAPGILVANPGARDSAIQVLAWPEALPLYVIPINFAIAAGLVLLGSRLFKLGWGRVEV